MRRWNGWGDDGVRIDLPSAAEEVLREQLGDGRVQPDCPLGKLLAGIPKPRLRPHGLVSSEPKSRLDHAHGQSLPDWIRLRGGLLERFPDGVAFPTTVEEVGPLLRYAVEQGAVVIPFGGGTSVVGHLDVPETERPVLSLSLERLNELTRLEPENRLATFQAGIRGPGLERQLAERGFTLGHFPQSFEYSTLGGWVATRSSGQQSAHYGRIDELYQGGEIVTPRGLLRLPPFPASAAGPDLRQWILGSEGRLGVLTEAVVRISPIPESDDFYGFFFPNWDAGRDAVRELAVSDVPFSMVRLSDGGETRMHLALAEREQEVTLLKGYLRLRGVPDEGACMCVVGLTGTRRQVRFARHESFAILRRHKAVAVGKAVGRAWKKYRFRAPYLRNALWDRGYAVDTLETAVTWEKVSPMKKAMEQALSNALAKDKDPVHVFSHLSSIYATGSSVYTTFVFRLANMPEETLERWKILKGSASRAIVREGGTISHQHGVGVDHREYLEAEKGAIGLDAMRQLLSLVDPGGHMNPGKLVSQKQLWK